MRLFQRNVNFGKGAFYTLIISTSCAREMYLFPASCNRIGFSSCFSSLGMNHGRRQRKEYLHTLSYSYYIAKLMRINVHRNLNHKSNRKISDRDCASEISFCNDKQAVAFKVDKHHKFQSTLNILLCPRPCYKHHNSKQY